MTGGVTTLKVYLSWIMRVHSFLGIYRRFEGLVICDASRWERFWVGRLGRCCRFMRPSSVSFRSHIGFDHESTGRLRPN